MAVDNGRYQVASSDGNPPEALDVCPYLHLARDSSTAATYARTDHRCRQLRGDQISFSWQHRYCVSQSHVECPYYLGQPSTGAHKVRRGGWGRRRRHGLEMAGLLIVLALLIVILLGLTTGYGPSVIGAFFDDSSSAAGSTVEPRSEPEALRPPLFHTFTQVRDPAGDVPGRVEAPGRPDVPDFAANAFQMLWMRTDEPVRDLGIERNWVWGPQPLTTGIEEEWIEAPDGKRLAQYFPKGRMEHVAGSMPSSGLLVMEMFQGRYQTGQNSYADGPATPDVPLAGDDTDTGLPTYSDISRLGLLAPPGRALGDLIDESIVGDHIERDERYALWNVTARETVEATGHAIADVFADYLGAQGTIYTDGGYRSAPLFEPRYNLVGLPITEAYWATVDVEGEPQDVLWQCFERRCLTYTPASDDGRQIDSGDAGRHYYQWRYGELDRAP